MQGLDSYVEYPADVFPPEIANFISGFAHGAGSQQSYVGISVLGMASVFFENCSLRVKPGYLEYPNFYLGIIGNPGVTKTASVKTAMKPLALREREEDLDYRILRKKYKDEFDQWQASPPRGRGAAPKKPEPPIRRAVTDGSVEAMIKQMDAQYEKGERPHMIYIKDELKGFFGGMNKWRGGGDDYEMFLQLFSGYDINKLLKEEQYFIPDARCTVIGGIQPDVYKEAMEDKGDGMVDRFLIAFFDGDPTKTSLHHVVEDHVIDAYIGFWDQFEGRPTILYRFDDKDVIDAVEDFHEWTHKIGDTYELGAFKKWEQNFYKICIILACMWGKTKMDLETVERAKLLAGYMTHDWLKSRLNAETDPRYKDAEKVLKNLEKYERRSLRMLASSVRCVRKHEDSSQYLVVLLQILRNEGKIDFNTKEAWVK